MSIYRNRTQQGYGYPSPTSAQYPEPIVTSRAPATTDHAEVGTIWIDQSANAAYIAVKTTSGSTTWSATPSGLTTAAALTVNPGDITITAGDLVVSAGAATVTGAITGASITAAAGTINGNLQVTGTSTLADANFTGHVTVTGDFDLTNTASTLLRSTNNAAGALTLQTNGGALESIILQTVQGTSANSILLDGTVGGVTIQSGLASADAINLNASDAAGGIDIDAGTGGVDVLTTGALSLDASMASNLTVTGAADLTVYANGGSLVLQSSEATADSVRIYGSNAASGIDIDCGTAGFDVLTTGAFSIDGATASNVTVTGASEDLSLQAVGGSVNITSTEADAAAIRIYASDVAGGIDIDCGTANFTVNSTGALNMQGEANSFFATDGAGINTNIVSLGGSVVIDGAEASANAVSLTASDATGGISITSGTGATTLTSTGATTIDAAGVLELNSSAAAIGIGNDDDAFAINIGTGAAARTVTVGNTTGVSSVVVDVGTGNASFGASATAHATLVGSTTAGSSLALQTPTGTAAVAANGVSVSAAGRGYYLPGGVAILSGAETPNGTVVANLGSIFLRTDPGNANERIYINTDSATTWVPIAASA